MAGALPAAARQLRVHTHRAVRALRVRPARRRPGRRTEPAGRRGERDPGRSRRRTSGGIAMAEATTQPPAARSRAAEEAGFYHEAGLSAAWVGTRLALGALSFGFGSFLFAYFYLRSLNSHGLWYPSSLAHPHLWSGTLIMGLIVVSAATATAALQRLKAGH